MAKLIRYVYVVSGSTGEYSDQYNWPVAAYKEEEMAQQHVTAAEAWARVFEQEVNASDKWRGELVEEVRKKGGAPHDPNFEMDYTGTHYYYTKVPLATKFVPQIEEAI
jgi:hypothetical protein